MAKTLFDKLWADHEVAVLEDNVSLLYIDRIFLHERTGSIALESLASDGRVVRNPEKVFCTMDHIVDTHTGRTDETLVPGGKQFIQSTRAASKAAGIKLFDITDPWQGIAHVISPELGIVQPGCTLICPDSHTCSQGALGALAWGVGSSEAEHAMATNTLVVKRPNTMRVNFVGKLPLGLTAKDLILHLISKYGAAGGSGCAIEFAGEVVESLSIESRLTLCNMAVEFSAFTGLIAPDQKTIDYLRGKQYAPKGEKWLEANKYWATLSTDSDAVFDKEITIVCDELAPVVTWGTSPQHACGVSDNVPSIPFTLDANDKASYTRAYQYMDLHADQLMESLSIDAAFIGSCTNSRITDLREAAGILKGRKVAEGVNAICVPGSKEVKRMAEKEGLDKIFIDAGFEWREPGCSMCFFAGGENFGFRKRVISSTNRNFEGRQGPETRSHLASPITVAASAITGKITDPRKFL
ncbi:3-isopropylmalate dehydratase large subunit [Pseudocolwellia sp. HL-MZ19]|uniref:3-isopropylmalate dehydratase large subunit n=1 Tax=unclassified Pseudocolwellia TaxID=2848178 RepID=UPI003CF8D731